MQVVPVVARLRRGWSKVSGYKKRVPADRSPLVTIGQEVFMDLLWAFGDEVIVTGAQLTTLLRTTSKDQLFIGRRLRRDELRWFQEMRRHHEAEVMGHLVPSDEARWNGRWKRKVPL